MMNFFSSSARLEHAPDCTRAMKGTGAITAGTKLVPVASELTLPTCVPSRMSQICAS